STVSVGIRLKNWNTKPIRRRRRSVRSRSDSAGIETPSSNTSPDVGGSIPAIRCKSVDLPDPLRPTSTAISPRPTEAFAPRSTVRDRPPSVKVRVTLRISRTGGGPGIGKGEPPPWRGNFGPAQLLHAIRAALFEEPLQQAFASAGSPESLQGIFRKGHDPDGLAVVQPGQPVSLLDVVALAYRSGDDGPSLLGH